MTSSSSIRSSKPDLIQIVDLEVAQGDAAASRRRKSQIELDETAKEFLIEKGYDPTYGARPMRRAVERYLEDPLAEELLKGNVKAGDLVQVTVENGKLVFKVAEPHNNAAASAVVTRAATLAAQVERRSSP